MEAKINMLPVSFSLRKFKVLESTTQVMVVASDKHQEEWHVIFIDKKLSTDSDVTLDDIIKEEIKTFTKSEFDQYIKDYRERGSSTNPRSSWAGKAAFNLQDKKDYNFQENTRHACGILGFVRFLKGFYLIMITQKKKVAMIGQHKIY